MIYICRMPRRFFSLVPPMSGHAQPGVRAVARRSNLLRAGPVYFRVGHAGLPRSVSCVCVAYCLFPGSLAHSPVYAIVSPFRLVAWGSVYSRTGPVYVCPRPRRVISPLAPTRAMPSMLFGHLLGSDVQCVPGRAQVTFAYGTFVKCTQLFSQAFVVRARRYLISRSRSGYSFNFRTGPGLYLLEIAQGCIAVCFVLGQVPPFVWAFARRSSRFQGGSSLFSRRPRRIILCISRQSGPFARRTQPFSHAFVVWAKRRSFSLGRRGPANSSTGPGLLYLLQAA